MTKNEYLIELAVKLQGLTDKPAALHDEIKKMISFYQEMIDDKIEDGMTEKEAVAAMESPEEIAERLKAETEDAAAEEAADEAPVEEAYRVKKDTVQRIEYAPEVLNSIVVEDENNPVQVVFGDKIAVTYQDGTEGEYIVDCTGGNLFVKYRMKLRSIFRLPFFGSNRKKLLLEVPRGWNGVLDVGTSNAKIELEAEINEIYLCTSNAKIGISYVKAARLRTVTSNGSTYAEHAECEYAEFVTSNAKIDVSDIKASEELRLATSNGSVTASDITAAKFGAKSSNGGIKVEGIVSDDIEIKTSNGQISGTIAGKMADYAITAGTSNGRNSLPEKSDGEKKLSVKTSNARIAVEFAE